MDLLRTDGDSSLQVLWEDGERVVCRGWRLDPDGNRSPVLAVLPAVEHPAPATLDRSRVTNTDCRTNWMRLGGAAAGA